MVPYACAKNANINIDINTIAQNLVFKFGRYYFANS